MTIEKLNKIVDEISEYIETDNLDAIDFTVDISDEYIDKVNKMPKLLPDQLIISHTLFIFKFLRDKYYNGKENNLS
jgi:hypothetical protein